MIVINNRTYIQTSKSTNKQTSKMLTTRITGIFFR